MPKFDHKKAHELYKRLMDTAANIDHATDVRTALLAVEMHASVVRRFAIADGVTKEEMRDIRAKASACGREEYDVSMAKVNHLKEVIHTHVLNLPDESIPSIMATILTGTMEEKHELFEQLIKGGVEKAAREAGFRRRDPAPDESAPDFFTRSALGQMFAYAVGPEDDTPETV